MAVSISAISRDWSCARSYVQRCVKRGCSTESLAAARLWRTTNQQRSRNPAKQVFESTTSDSEELTQILSPSGRHAIPEDIGDDLVLGSKEAVRQSWRLLREALIEGKAQKIGAWLSIHTRAVEARVKAEAMVREEQERQRILVPLAEAKCIVGKALGVIVSRLNALPQNVAARCDLTNPQMTMTILEEECAMILNDARQAL